LSREIEIVGGGLAGLALGILLRERGVGVTLREAGQYPRHRVCGEFFAGRGEAYLRRLGLDLEAGDPPRHTSSHWSCAQGPLVSRNLPHPALGLSRYRLDALLADRFVALGGHLRTGERVHPGRPPGRVWAAGRLPDKHSPWIGLKAHTRHADRVEGLEVHFGDGAYVGLSAVEGGRLNVCGLFRRRDYGRVDRRSLLQRALEGAGLEALAERVASLGLDEESHSAVSALRLGWSEPAADAIFIGDAGGVIPPFTGDGMSLALEMAFLAADPVEHYARGRLTWAECVRRTHGAIRRRCRQRFRWAAWLHPFLLHRTGQRTLLLAARVGCLPFTALHRFTHGNSLP
jgi:flavin-dependent dehydrogenase